MGCELLGSGHEADHIPPSPVPGAQPRGWDQVGVSLQGHLRNAVEGQVSDKLSGAGPGPGAPDKGEERSQGKPGTFSVISPTKMAVKM